MKAAAWGLALGLAFEAAPASAARRPAIPELARTAPALRTGRYEDALRLCHLHLARAPGDLVETVLCARAETATGLYPEARRRLEAAAAAHPGDLPLRDALMRLYEATGDRAAWKPLVDASYVDWNGGQVDRTKPADLRAIATAVRLDENWKDANDVLRDAVRADRKEVGANLDWGTLLLEKHNAADAETSFREVLKVGERNVVILVAPAGIGVIFGLALLNIIGPRIGRSRTIGAGLIVTLTALLGLAAARPFAEISQRLSERVGAAGLGEAFPFFVATVAGTAFVFGIAYSFVTVPSMTLLQEELRDDIRGRVFGVLNMLISVFSLLPLVLVGPIADVWGVAPVFVVAAVIVGGVWVGGRSTRGARPTKLVTE